MPHDWNAPQVDNRPPDYALGKNFSMVGPSRLVIIASSFPPVSDRYNYVCLPPVGGEWYEQQFYYFTWAGKIDDIFMEATLFNANDVYSGFTMNYVQYREDWSFSRYCFHNSTRFVWQRTGFTAEWQLPYIGEINFHRMPEWDTVLRRFPAVTIAEEL